MRKVFFVMMVIIFFSTSYTFALNTAQISTELAKFNVKATGPGDRPSKETLPDDFGPLPWGLIYGACNDSGYDLLAYKSKEVLETVLPINKQYGSQALNAAVLSLDDKIICIYAVGRPGAMMLIPGIFSIKNL